MQYIDKNDVNISKLFEWGKSLVITDAHDTPVMTLYIRLIGDSDMNKARVYGLRKSAELRKKLRENNSEERLAYIPEFEFIEKENLIESTLSFQLKELTDKAFKNLDLQLPKEPSSDATLEELENYQKEVDSWPRKRENEVRKVVEDAVDTERKSLNLLSKDELSKRYETFIINSLCETEMYTKFQEMCVYYGTFLDDKCKQLAFNSIEEFSNLPEFIKTQIIDSYYSLDIKVEELKK